MDSSRTPPMSGQPADPYVNVFRKPLRPFGFPVPGLRPAERQHLLLVMDIFCINLTLAFFVVARPTFALTMEGIWSRLPLFFVLTIIWRFVSTLFDHYDLSRAARPLQSVGSAGIVSIIATTLYIHVPQVSSNLSDNLLMLLLFAASATLAVAVWRGVYAHLLVRPAFTNRVIVIGASKRAREMTSLLVNGKESDRTTASRHTGYELIGFVETEQRGPQIGSHDQLLLGHIADLLELFRRYQPDELIMAVTAADHPNIEVIYRIVEECHALGCTVTDLDELYEQLLGRVPIPPKGTAILESLSHSLSASHRIYLFVRRITDILFGIVGCLSAIVLAPVLLIANRLCAPGPILYWQERVGKDGRPFQLVKFRSMVDKAENTTGVVWAAERDSRVTWVGSILRRSRLDELPQAWNILRGDMTLIGPRPERPKFVQELTSEVRFYRARQHVLPGLTGWAQVQYRYVSSVDESRIKLEYDLYYIKHIGPTLDMRILAKTLQVVVRFGGR